MPAVPARFRLTAARFRAARRRVLALVAVVVVVALVAVGALTGLFRSPAAPVRTEQLQLAVPAGPGQPGSVTLDSTLYLPARTPAPAVLVAHGFGGSKASVDADARDLAASGYVVLAWSARGFGRSTGQIALDSPDYEVADASRLLDYLATRPEVELDGPGDPRVGVTGGSYGGALALLLAGHDHRVDALAPVITWNDLGQALFPNAASTGPVPVSTPALTAFGADGVFKRGWAGVFFSAGLSSRSAGGASPSPGAAGSDPASASSDSASASAESGRSDDTPDSSDVEAPPSGLSSPAAGSGGSANSGGSGGGAGGGSGSGGSGGSGGGSGTGSSAGVGAGSAETSAAEPGSAPGSSPSGAPTTNSCGRFVAAVCQAYAEAATTGRASPATVELLRRSSPASVADRIAAPTLLVQGEADTLFGLDQADATARQIAAGGGTVSVIWYSGGHDGGAPGPTVRARIAAWFDTYLRRGGASGADTRAGVPRAGRVDYAVRGGVRARSTPTVRTVTADRYPGLAGAPPVRLDSLPLRGPAQDVLNPPGATPAALTSVPGGGLGSLAGRLPAFAAPPGQSATFSTGPVARQVLVAGSSRVRISLARVAGQPTSAEAVLFGGLTDVAPDGRRTLLGGAVAPMRVPVPAGTAPVEVTVTLPAVVAPVAAGHRLVVSFTTTDQAYQGATAPAMWRIALAPGNAPGSAEGRAGSQADPAGTSPGAAEGRAGGADGATEGAEAALAVPVVPGRSVTANTVPTGPALGIAAVLAAALLAWLLGWLRQRGSRRDSAPPPASTDPPPLRISNLGKTYPGGIAAVAGVSFTLRRNQVLGLLGPNGAGKTTVLRMLLGLVHPSEGEMRVFGHRVSPGAEVLSRVGAFVEGPGLLPHLSGLTNLRLCWASTGRPAEDARLDEALRIAGLGEAVHRTVRTYSQGMRQRLALAQAILGLPDLLVLDEPTNGLDPPQISAMREVLRRYARGGRSVLLSSHLLAEVEQTCDHVVVMHQGRVVADGTVAELAAGAGQASFRVDDPNRAARVLAELSGVGGVQVDGASVHADLNGTPRADVVRRLVAAGIAVESAGPRRRLEDAFLRLVGEESR